jgi:surfeit locus 1 family protein
MLLRLRQAGLYWPTAISTLAALLLVGLGTWQLERKQWKEALIAAIAARAGAPPVPVAEAQARAARGEDIAYLHVSASGRFLHAAERYFYAPGPSGLGWHVYTPLALTAQRFLWVNRGFVPDARRAPQTRRDGLLEGEVAVHGLVRVPARRGLFQPDNDPGANIWYWPDIPAMSASAGLAGTSVPFVVDADRWPEAPGGLPRGGVTPLSLPNRHLEYAITWYALALTLVIVYVAFVAARLREEPPAAA